MKIYHNPRCSKSRQTLALIQESGKTVDIIQYLDTPPTANELAEVLNLLRMAPQELVRTKEALFKELGLHEQTLTDQQWIQILCENPKLIERPIVVSGNKAVIGRPPELVKPLLD